MVLDEPDLIVVVVGTLVTFVEPGVLGVMVLELLMPEDMLGSTLLATCKWEAVFNPDWPVV